MRILLLSAYDAASHRYWREGVVRELAEHNWTQLTLPARHYAWRVRGNALAWFSEQRAVLNQQYDLIVATSMVDLATLKGLAGNLATIPSILYFHENQFAYPASGTAHSPVEAQITSIYSAMAANTILFNSDYNRRTFMHGARTLLKKLPDHAPLSIVDDLSDKSAVLPVPLEDSCFKPRHKPTTRPLTLVWNHRWEYDKGPDELLLVLQSLRKAGLDFRIHIIGQQFRNTPPAFETIHQSFAANILSWGHVEQRADYLQLLQQSDMAISTARHDFQGLAIQEAMAAGCIPIAPDSLAYPEYIPSDYLCPVTNDSSADAAAMASRIIQRSADMPAQPPDISALSWCRLRDHYRTTLLETAGR